MSGLKSLYRKFIRKACGTILYEVEQCREENRRLQMEEKRLENEKRQLEERIVGLEENIRKNNGRLNALERTIDETRFGKVEENIRQNNGRLNALERTTNETRFGKVEENIRQNNGRLNALERTTDETRLGKLEENIRQNNGRLNALERATDETRLGKLEENIRKNNQRINNLEKADSQLEMNLVKIRSSMRNTQGDAAAERRPGQTSEPETRHIPDSAGFSSGGDDYSKIDYFDFENHFRGSCQNIKDRQKMYIPYFQNCSRVLDLGCGRGEFLELLKENGILAKGIDLYSEYAEYCRMKELDVECGDAIQYLLECEPVDGIMAAQLVEHLNTDQIVTLCETAYERLNEGGVLIMETPNPCALSIYVNEFYMDPSHIKPVHPETLKYLAQKAGFKNVEVVYTEVSKVPKRIAALELNTEGNLQEFNSSLQEVSELLYGSRDYAIIARK